MFGPEIIKEAERQVQIVRENLKVAQSQQKSYADTRRRELSFEEGEFVYLKVSPIRDLCRFKVKGKLSPRYIGPFKILSRKGEVTYELELPSRLSDVHNVFHISQLKKCLRVPEEELPLEELNVHDDLTYTEYTVKFWILWKGLPGVKGYRCVKFSGVIMQRMRLLGNERMSCRQNFPSSLLTRPNLEDEIHFKGVGL